MLLSLPSIIRLPLPIHHITDILSFYLGYRYYLSLRKRYGDTLPDTHRNILIIGAAFGALIGSRLLASLENLHAFFNPPSLLYYYANQTIIGGIIGGIIGVEITKKTVGIRPSTGDLFVFPLMLGIAVGRIGCFLTGISDGTTGIPSKLPWALDQGDGIMRHPTSLYEILFLGFLAIVLKQLSQKKALKNGVLFRLFIIFYFLFRTGIECIKPVEHVLWQLSVTQIACLGVSGYYITTLFRDKALYTPTQTLS